MSDRARTISGEGTGQRPNFLVLFTDDQRFDTLRAWGNPEIVTPNLDRLAQEGVSFTHACIMGGTVPAVCMPSRSMLMSGRTLFHTPLNLEGTLTFPQWLREGGYHTFTTGKWHNERESLRRSFDSGAKIFFGGMCSHREVPVHDFDPSGAYPADSSYIGSGFSTELFSEEAIGFLRRYDREQPFCAYVSYTAPHDPRMAPQRYQDLYQPERLSLPDNFLPEHPFDNGELRIRDELLAAFPRTPEEIRQHIADYYAMITHLDEFLGRVLETLEETGLAENTIVIFAGDNGLAVGQHGLMGKQNLYDHGIRVPLILWGPGMKPGLCCDALCYLLDLFPTFCDLAGLPVPESVEGQSLVPLLYGERQRLREDQFHAYREVQRAVRDERYKLIEYFPPAAPMTQLFDLQEDPAETRNLAPDPQHADTLERLRERLQDWQRKVSDPLLGR